MNTRRTILAAIPLGLASALLGACSAAPPADDATASEELTTPSPHAHPMAPMRPDEAAGADLGAAVAAGANASLCNPPKGIAAHPHLSPPGWFSGGVLQSAHLYNVGWGDVANGATMNRYVDWLARSSFAKNLGEYGISSASFVSGSVATGVQPPSRHVTDADIRSMLATLVRSGHLPQASDQSLFIVWLPPGVSVDASQVGAGITCQDHCGYHNRFQSRLPPRGLPGGPFRNYAVIPDLTQCGGHCGVNGTQAADDFVRQAVASHEIAEALTDSDVGNVWYDSQTYQTKDAQGHTVTKEDGEIGDICAWQNYSANGFGVQCEWSNRANTCVPLVR